MAESQRAKMLMDLQLNPYNFGQLELIKLLFDNCLKKSENEFVASYLYDAYGSLRNLLQVKPHELNMIVDIPPRYSGVVSTFSTVYEVLDRDMLRACEPERRKSIRDVIEFRFKNIIAETLEIYYINKKGRIFETFTVTQHSSYKVDIPIDKIFVSIAIKSPARIIIAHNHPSGSFAPSQSDFDFTNYMIYRLGMDGVQVVDHYIYAGPGRIFSFKEHGFLNDSTLDYYSFFENIFDSQGFDEKKLAEIDRAAQAKVAKALKNRAENKSTKNTPNKKK